MEINSIGASLPSIVSEVGRTEQATAHPRESHRLLESALAVPVIELTSFKAFFAIDEDKNVVIRIMDDEGKVIKQIPPAEYLAMMGRLSETSRTLFHLEA